MPLQCLRSTGEDPFTLAISPSLLLDAVRAASLHLSFDDAPARPLLLFDAASPRSFSASSTRHPR
eukprot:1732469-Rhodomonas_salina.1